MTTLNELRGRIQNLLADASGTTFTYTLIEEWIEDAIREYGQHFSIFDTYGFTTSVGEAEYELFNFPIKNIFAVEYPTNQEPRSYLEKRDRFDTQGFHRDDQGYDYEVTGEAGARIVLYFSKTDFENYEAITVYTLQAYDEDAATIELPVEHETIIIARVKWMAYEYLVAQEMTNPTNNSSLLMGQMQQNANSARKSYFQLLTLALFKDEGKSEVIRWEMDGFDRIY
jgi:hypothetical protein